MGVRFVPESSLSACDGRSGAAVNGTWTLRIDDTLQDDSGTLFCWGVALRTP